MYVLISDIGHAFYPRLELALWDHAQDWWEAIDDSSEEWAKLDHLRVDGELNTWLNVYESISSSDLLVFYDLTKGDQVFGPVIKRVFDGSAVDVDNVKSDELHQIDASYRRLDHKIKLED